MTNDDQILALFRQWCAAWRASNRRGMSDDEIADACDVANGIAQQIYAAPVEGVTGLAVKAYMVGEMLDGADARPDTCVLGTVYEGADALRGLLASAAALLPELEPLLRQAIAPAAEVPVMGMGPIETGTRH